MTEIWRPMVTHPQLPGHRITHTRPLVFRSSALLLPRQTQGDERAKKMRKSSFTAGYQWPGPNHIEQQPALTAIRGPWSSSSGKDRTGWLPARARRPASQDQDEKIVLHASPEQAPSRCHGFARACVMCCKITMEQKASPHLLTWCFALVRASRSQRPTMPSPGRKAGRLEMGPFSVGVNPSQGRKCAVDVSDLSPPCLDSLAADQQRPTVWPPSLPTADGGDKRCALRPAATWGRLHPIMSFAYD